MHNIEAQMDTLDVDEGKCFEKQKQEHKLGIMLIAVSVMFIVCQSFKMVPDFYEIFFCFDKNVSIFFYFFCNPIF